jgi:hypothetical protein
MTGFSAQPDDWWKIGGMRVMIASSSCFCVSCEDPGAALQKYFN